MKIIIRFTILGLICFLSLCFQQVATAQESTEDANTSEQYETMEEVVVFGNKNLRSLRIEVRDAEVAIYDMFNKINLDDRYDIHCRMEARLGTRIKQHICRPNFFYDATRDDALATLAEFQGFATSGRGADATSVVRNHNVTLEVKLREAIKENPELLKVIQEFDSVRSDYNDRRKDYFDEE